MLVIDVRSEKEIEVAKEVQQLWESYTGRNVLIYKNKKSNLNRRAKQCNTI